MESASKNLERTLSTELVGKDVGYSHWNFTSALLKTVRALAHEAGLNEGDFSYEEQSGKNSAVYLTYKGVVFGEASFQKQKGKYHHGRYDWTFKSVTVNLWSDYEQSRFAGLDLVGIVTTIEDELRAAEDCEAKKLAKAKELFQKIKEELGTEDDYEVARFIEYMNKNRYSIRG